MTKRVTSPRNVPSPRTGPKSNAATASRVRESDQSYSLSTNVFTVGHGAKRCPEPPKDEAAGEGFDSGAGGFDAAAPVAGGDWEMGANGGGDSPWAAAPAAATATVGGW